MPVPVAHHALRCVATSASNRSPARVHACVRVFEASKEILDPFGERHREIVLRPEHSSDRGSDSTIARADLLRRCAWLATRAAPALHHVLPALVCLDRVPHTNATGVLRLRSAKTRPGTASFAALVNFYLKERRFLNSQRALGSRGAEPSGICRAVAGCNADSFRSQGRIPAGTAGRRNDRHPAGLRRWSLDIGIYIGRADHAVGLLELLAQRLVAGTPVTRLLPRGAGLRVARLWRGVRRRRRVSL
jgi:hypothetical protein